MLQLQQQGPGQAQQGHQGVPLTLQHLIDVIALGLFAGLQALFDLLPVDLQGVRNQADGLGLVGQLLQGIKPLGNGLFFHFYRFFHRIFTSK